MTVGDNAPKEPPRAGESGPVASEALKEHADRLAALIDALIIDGDACISGYVKGQAQRAVAEYRIWGAYSGSRGEPV